MIISEDSLFRMGVTFPIRIFSDARGRISDTPSALSLESSFYPLLQKHVNFLFRYHVKLVQMEVI